MDDKPNILLVYSHPKGDSGNDYLDLISHPFILDLLSLVIVQNAVVEVTLDTVVLAQCLRKFLALLS